MPLFTNTKPKAKTSIDKEVSAGVNSGIFLKFVNPKVQTLSKGESLAKKISNDIMLQAWNVNCGIPISDHSTQLTYNNEDPNTKIVLVSTWDIKCGIATYTSYLLNNINNINNINKFHNNEIVGIFPMNKKNSIYKIDNDIIHLQHEFGIMPYTIETDSKVIVTFHTIHKNPKSMLASLESRFSVVGYIAHSEVIKRVLMENTYKDVHLIPHGSEIIELPYKSKSLIRKELNFDKLGINDNDICAFVFGFQSANKDYNILTNACKNVGVKLIISNATHENDDTNEPFTGDGKHVICLNRFLSEIEIDMFSSACDLLIFDCMSENHYSCSGSMHRVIGSGNPVICSRVNHFDDLIENEDCLKFEDQKELELKIKEALDKKEEFSAKSLRYAEKTSWKTVAKQHLDVYNKYTDVYENKEYDNIDYSNKVVFVSSWGVKCGIALYTEDLFNNVKEIQPNKFEVRNIKSSYNLKAKLLHFQHEFGIMPVPPKVSGKVIITWHTVGNFVGNNNMSNNIKKFEKVNDIVAHIVTCEGARSVMKTTKDVYVVSLGSKLMKFITKENARKLLNISNIDKPIGFIFGFQSENKNYDRLIKAAKATNIHLIICSSVHSCGYNISIKKNEDITFVDKYLTDDEIDLYASASDILLFDYASQNHYSSSSAMHRTVGAGRPLVCHDTNHFNDIKTETDGVLKFKNDKELVKCILEALKRKDELGNKALEYAKRTSRENVAKKHLEIYSKYVTL